MFLKSLGLVWNSGRRKLQLANSGLPGNGQCWNHMYCIMAKKSRCTLKCYNGSNFLSSTILKTWHETKFIREFKNYKLLHYILHEAQHRDCDHGHLSVSQLSFYVSVRQCIPMLPYCRYFHVKLGNGLWYPLVVHLETIFKSGIGCIAVATYRYVMYTWYTSSAYNVAEREMLASSCPRFMAGFALA